MLGINGFMFATCFKLNKIAMISIDRFVHSSVLVYWPKQPNCKEVGVGFGTAYAETD